MKRSIALLLAILSLTAVLCACGKSATPDITTTVQAKYDDGYAQSYASGSSVDSDGNKVYEFTDDKYEEFIQDHKNTLSNDIQQEFVRAHDSGYGEFVYINTEKQAVIVGIHEEEYDEAAAESEAAVAAEYGFKYFQNLQEPVSSIKVIYCNANNQDEEYGSFEFTAE